MRLEGASRRDPARRAADHRRQPRLEPRRGRHRVVAHARASAGGSTGWARRSSSPGRSSAGPRRNGGVHPVDREAADVEAFRLAKRILDEGHVLFVFPEGTRSPDGALQEARDGVAVLALRTGAPDRAGRDRGLVRRLAARPEAAASRRSRHDPCRPAVPPRRRDPARDGPARRQGPGHDADHGAHRGAPAARAAGRLRRPAEHLPPPASAPPPTPEAVRRGVSRGPVR